MTFCGPIEDRLAIRELIDTYADAINRQDAADWGDTWAEDGTWMIPDLPQFPVVHGRTAIVEAWKAAMTQFPGVIFSAAPGRIEIDGDHASVRSYTYEIYDRDGSTRRDNGRYDDVCVKRDGKWYFLSRTFKSLRQT
ncbi:MAG: nuclear transport factor 2 family protein [Sphingomonadaceae bacterium]